MNILNLNFNGIKDTLNSFNVFNISFNKQQETSKISEKIKEKPILLKEKVPTDYKTTLGGWNLDVIDKIEDDLIVYLFIQKEIKSSAWNLVAPIVLEKSTGKINQYGLGYFALQGMGGGLSNTSSMLFRLKNHKNKGFKVSILPKIVNSELLSNYEYVDGGVKLSDLIENSLDLINYRKKPFDWIYKQYIELLQEHDLE
ncbi:hypothetical protein GTQ40_06350 [Flavobacteriaceae bacterium R38]|nr:hypothetical protein [Flavobacteriaceae bacterium R38]